MGRRSRTREKTEEILELDKLTEEEKKNRRQRKILNHQLKLKSIRPLTENQKKAFHSYFSGQNLLLFGCAGTGKTYIALYLALNDLLKGMYTNLIICRSAVASRDVGFLPGTLVEKMALYEVPYREMVQDLCERGDAYDLMKSKGAVEFMSTSFLRGLTFDDSIIIIDEVQNMTWHEISSILTRVGEGSKIIICGDFNQNDLSINAKRQESGMEQLLKTCETMQSFDLVPFEIKDIVRSGFVKEFIIATQILKHK